jgi:lauroyl/myristoyl acyltransferase
MLLRTKSIPDPTVSEGETRAKQTPQWYTHSYNRVTLYHLVVVCSPFIPRPIRFGLARTLAAAFRWMMPRECAAARHNIGRILPDADTTAIERVIRSLFCNFAYSFADLLSLNRRAQSVQRRYVRRVHGEEHLHTALASRRGFVAATAHVGNWDLAGKLLSSYGRTVHVLMAPEQEAAVQRLLRERNHPAGLRFVTNEGAGVFMQLLMALRRGEVVAFQADRVTGHRSDVPVTFFGAPALFPSGPFALAAAAQVPVLPCFCLMRSDHRYDIFVDEAIMVSRGHEKVALQQMVRVLERYVAMAPDQWFNFYDVWNDSTS